MGRRQRLLDAHMANVRSCYSTSNRADMISRDLLPEFGHPVTSPSTKVTSEPTHILAALD